VQSGGNLKGSGTIGGNVTVEDGGALSPGSPQGGLIIGGDLVIDDSLTTTTTMAIIPRGGINNIQVTGTATQKSTESKLRKRSITAAAGTYATGTVYLWTQENSVLQGRDELRLLDLRGLLLFDVLSNYSKRSSSAGPCKITWRPKAVSP
jgi:hypothetical protein